MAPLKVVVLIMLDPYPSQEYPWLKGHGSIEGLTATPGAVTDYTYPWLKGHGSIEGRIVSHQFSHMYGLYPWLKGHGSIEGVYAYPV